MNFCIKCGHKMEGGQFCPKCGSPISTQTQAPEQAAIRTQQEQESDYETSSSTFTDGALRGMEQFIRESFIESGEKFICIFGIAQARYAMQIGKAKIRITPGKQ